ncbi:hypothetical protein MNB_SUP05-SYMBIONT-5-1361 [hydrothermal vent metagenome]|uniref:Uncharacterized protein n=1 Tax=hydrothermal vent metagenome TaxID=652676 RepID=A0A1W1E087_9ZZZZ
MHNSIKSSILLITHYYPQGGGYALPRPRLNKHNFVISNAAMNY